MWENQITPHSKDKIKIRKQIHISIYTYLLKGEKNNVDGWFLSKKHDSLIE